MIVLSSARCLSILIMDGSQEKTTDVTLLHRYIVTFAKFVCKTLQVYIYIININIL